MRVDALVKEFDASAQVMVVTVSTAAAKLQSAAASMSATAKETSRRSTAVAAASEQASTNVQTVASATEQLSASVREVGLQVAESAKIATKAVEEAQLSGNAGSVFIGRTGRVRRLDAQARRRIPRRHSRGVVATGAGGGEGASDEQIGRAHV